MAADTASASLDLNTHNNNNHHNDNNKDISSLEDALSFSIQRTKLFFGSDYNSIIPSLNEESLNEARNSKRFVEYNHPLLSTSAQLASSKAAVFSNLDTKNMSLKTPIMGPLINNTDIDTTMTSTPVHEPINAMVRTNFQQPSSSLSSQIALNLPVGSRELIRRKKVNLPNPVWHAPWKLMRVISGHTGWVRSVAVDVSNEWFATGSGDRTIKIWDLASGTLKLSLTGHLSTVRGLEVSDRHPYLFSGGEDKLVKCWDLEQNKVIRHYHGHLSGVYTLALHPVLDILVTAGRDAVGRVWDMRTKQPIFTLTGHSSTIASVKCQAPDPQVITSSMDGTIRLWDLKTGKAITVLTHHKKSVRGLALHPREFSFASASPDNIKKFQFPNGDFLHNFTGHTAIINTLSINEDNVLFSGADNGSMCFWDWRSGHCFQKTSTLAQPGSLDSETGIFASTFDRTGLRLITCEADKSIKIWKEDEEAQEIETNR